VLIHHKVKRERLMLNIELVGEVFAELHANRLAVRGGSRSCGHFATSTQVLDERGVGVPVLTELRGVDSYNF
jgi:hypothetical protein